MEKLIARLVSRGWSQGVLQGRRLWLMLGGAAWVVRKVRKGEPDVVYTEQLAPGQRLMITHRYESLPDLEGRRWLRKRPPAPFS